MNNLQKVQKKKKAQKPNAFWIFAMELKNKLLKQGKFFSNDVAGAQWSKLTPEQREPYRHKSKNSDPVVNTTRKIYNTLGEDVEEVEARRKSKLENYEKMQNEIAEMLEDANEDGVLDDLVVHLICTTSFYRSAEGVFPAELAVAKFSLRKGIHEEIQVRINPGKLPLGASCDASQKSKETHRYDLPPNCEGEQDYLTILEIIMKFILPLEEIPIFFCEKDQIDEAKRTIDLICYESQEDDLRSQFKIYPIEELLFKLNILLTSSNERLNGVVEGRFLSVVNAGESLKEPSLAYATPGCEFHNEKDVAIHCCLSKVRVLGYVLAKWCSNGKRYELVEGCHFPKGFKSVN